MLVKDLLKKSVKELGGSKVSEPESSARVLLGDVLNMTRTELLANNQKKVTRAQQEKFSKYIERRKKHESVWHIIGRVPFWGMELFVTKDVLVPRPETEILVEKIITEVMTRKYNVNGILDMGTGSGTIALALANEFPEINFTAADVSEKALRVARKNAKHNAAPNVEFVHSDLFENIEGKFDIVAANLPYIPEKEMKALSVDVHHFEPKLALSGGKDGLEVYEKFFKNILGYLNKGGSIFCEINHNQGSQLKKISKKYLPKASCEIVNDLAEFDRIAIIRLPK